MIPPSASPCADCNVSEVSKAAPGKLAVPRKRQKTNADTETQSAATAAYRAARQTSLEQPSEVRSLGSVAPPAPELSQTGLSRVSGCGRAPVPVVRAPRVRSIKNA